MPTGELITDLRNTNTSDPYFGKLIVVLIVGHNDHVNTASLSPSTLQRRVFVFVGLLCIRLDIVFDRFTSLADKHFFIVNELAWRYNTVSIEFAEVGC